MITQGPSEGLVFNNDGDSRLSKSNEAHQHTQQTSSRQFPLRSQDRASCPTAIDASPLYTQPTRSGFWSPLVKSPVVENLGSCGCSSTRWLLEGRTDMNANTAPSDLALTGSLNGYWHSVYQEDIFMGLHYDVEQETAEKQLSRALEAPTCSASSLDTLNSTSHPGYPSENLFLEHRSDRRLSGCSSVSSYSRKSSSVPELLKVPIASCKTFKPNLQPIARTHDCRSCNMLFLSRKDLERHVVSRHVHHPQWFCPVPNCKFWSRGFKRKDKARAHIDSQHKNHRSARTGPVDAQTRQRTQEAQIAVARGSSPIHPYYNPRQPLTMNPDISSFDKGANSETDSCGSPLSSIAHFDLQFKRDDAFLDSKDLPRGDLNLQLCGAYRNECIYTDFGQMAAQVGEHVGYDFAGQDTDLIVKGAGEAVEGVVDFESLIQELTEPSPGDDLSFSARDESSIMNPMELGLDQDLSLDGYHYTY